MTVLHSLRSVYALENLDTRFTTSSKTPPADPARPQAVQDGTNKQTGLPAGARPSLWKTPEFFLYYIVFAVCVPLMFNSVYQVSQPSHENYKNFEDLLEPGWIPGRKVDNSDAQYSSFRENIPYLLALTVAHPLLRRIYNAIIPTQGGAQESQSASREAADTRMKQRLNFDFYFAFIFLGALHGSSIFKVLFVSYLNYSIATKLPRRHAVLATWVFNVGLLFANELCHGYPYGWVISKLLPWTDPKENWGTPLDRYGGLMPRWEVLFKVSILRFISFDIDYHWSLDRSASSALEKQLDPSNLSERDRVNIPANLQDYCFRNYFSYAFYAPLYLAGPILTFNDYLSQARYTPKSIKSTRTLVYGIRFLICVLTMEFLLHFVYAVAISKAKPAWEVYSPFQLSMLGYWNLHIIWLKLLIPWRCFRLWALVDGMDPPENMVRCMSNNYSALAFWRSWHRSFNRWTIRYIYIPMGGSGKPGEYSKYGKVRVVLNFLAVFTFVAIWHDINLRLLMWGWLVTLFITPEILATLAFPAKKWRDHPNQYRILCGIGASFNILMMMAANLVGFAVGLDGLKGLIQGIIGSFFGQMFLATACVVLYVGAQVMFETREEEKRHGIRMAC